MSRDVISSQGPPPTASYSLVKNEMHRIREFSAFYSHFQVTSGQTTSLPVLPVTRGMWSHFVTWLPPTVSYTFVGSEMYSIFEFLAFCSHFQVTSGKITSFLVTFGILKSRDALSCHMTASYCKLQPCTKWNVQNMRVYALLQPLPGTSSQMSLPSHFWSPEIIWYHFLSRDCLLLRATAL